MVRPLGFPHTCLFFPAVRTLSSIKLFSKTTGRFSAVQRKSGLSISKQTLCFLVVRNVLLADSDDLNLAQQLLGQLLHGHAGTSGLAGEILAVHAVESSEVFHVSQEAGGLDDVSKPRPLAARMALMLWQARSACSSMVVPTISPVPGIRGTWPEANRKPLAEIA